MLKALVVDDSSVVRKLGKNILTQIGFAVSEADDGDTALEFCKAQFIPNLILLDWNMARLSGLDFIKEFRKIPGNESCFIIFCTTENSLEKITEGITAGANEFVMKPFDTNIIRDKLKILGVIE